MKRRGALYLGVTSHTATDPACSELWFCPGPVTPCMRCRLAHYCAELRLGLTVLQASSPALSPSCQNMRSH